MRKLLWIGDACCDSGFARSTHKNLEAIGREFDVRVLGLNYLGDPHDFSYKIYPAMRPGQRRDFLGVERVVNICQEFMPDVVVVQNDPWNMRAYHDQLDRFTDFSPVRVGIVAIDGLNVDGEALNRFDRCVFWTKFALDEAVKGGYVKPGDVVPLGVDRSVYRPGDQKAARAALGIREDAFVVLNVNRNQPRKRLDLTFEYFHELITRFGDQEANGQRLRDVAKLMLHICPTGENGIDPKQLARYYGLDAAANGGEGKLYLADPGVYQGVPESQLVQEYQAADVYLSTSVGEGMGLPALEAMACGVPCVLPNNSAYGEWATAAVRVPCDATAITFGGPNVIGKVPNRTDTVLALRTLFTAPAVREHLSRQGLQLSNRDRFDWAIGGDAVLQTIETACFDREVGDAASTQR